MQKIDTSDDDSNGSCCDNSSMMDVSGEDKTASVTTARPPDAATPVYITELGDNDVLLGRGTGPCSHEGNVRFRDVIEAMRPQYVATPSRKAKTKVVLKAVQTIKAKKGRFLRKVVVENNKQHHHKLLLKKRNLFDKDEDVYEVVPDHVAIEKTKQAIRYVHYRKDADGKHLQVGGEDDAKIQGVGNQSHQVAESSALSFGSRNTATGGLETKDLRRLEERAQLGQQQQATALGLILTQRAVSTPGTAAGANRNPSSAPSQPPSLSLGTSSAALLQQLLGGGGNRISPTTEQVMLPNRTVTAASGFAFPPPPSMRAESSTSTTTLEDKLASALLAQQQQQQQQQQQDHQQTVLSSILSIKQQQQANANHHIQQAQHHLEQAVLQQALLSPTAPSPAATFRNSPNVLLDSLLLPRPATTPSIHQHHPNPLWAASPSPAPPPISPHPKRTVTTMVAPPDRSSSPATLGGMTRPDRILMQHAIEDPRLRALLMADEKCRQIIESYSRSASAAPSSVPQG